MKVDNDDNSPQKYTPAPSQKQGGVWVSLTAWLQKQRRARARTPTRSPRAVQAPARGTLPSINNSSPTGAPPAPRPRQRTLPQRRVLLVVVLDRLLPLRVKEVETLDPRQPAHDHQQRRDGHDTGALRPALDRERVLVHDVRLQPKKHEVGRWASKIQNRE